MFLRDVFAKTDWKSLSLAFFICFFLVWLSFFLSQPSYTRFFVANGAFVFVLSYFFPHRYLLYLSCYLGVLAGYSFGDPFDYNEIRLIVYGCYSLAFFVPHVILGVYLSGQKLTLVMFKRPINAVKVAALYLLVVGLTSLLLLGTANFIFQLSFENFISTVNLWFFKMLNLFSSAALFIPLFYLLLSPVELTRARAQYFIYGIFLALAPLLTLPFSSEASLVPTLIAICCLLFTFSHSAIRLSFLQSILIMTFTFVLYGFLALHGHLFGFIQDAGSRIAFCQVVVLAACWNSNLVGLFSFRLINFLRLAKKEREIVRAKLEKEMHQAMSVNFELNEKIQHNNQLRDLLEFKAYYDDLTGLPNANRFYKDFKQIQLDSNRVSVVIISLDNLMETNFKHGHAVGNNLIACLATSLDLRFSALATIYRWESSEFLMIFPDISKNHIHMSLDDFSNSFQSKVDIKGLKLRLDISIGGLVVHNEEPLTVILSNLNLSLEIGRQKSCLIRWFDAELNAVKVRRSGIDEDMESALDNGLIVPYFQPIVNADDFSIAGVEVVLRWLDKCGVPLYEPLEFIDIAERKGFVSVIGCRTISTCLNLHKKWSDTFATDFTLTINVSPLELNDDNFVVFLGEQISRSGVDSSKVNIEVSENIHLSKTYRLGHLLERIKQLGVQLSLDDFGAGHAGISYIQKYPFDIIKIDKIFVDDILTSKKSRSVLKALIVLTRELGLGVVAEGVETLEQAQELKALGVNQLQGFYFYKPMGQEAFELILENSRKNTPPVEATGL